MLSYESTVVFKSLVAPEVSYKLRKASHKRRTKLNLDAAKIFSKINDLQRQLAPINEEINRAEEAAKIESCECKHSLDPSDPEIVKLITRVADLNKDLKLEDQIVLENVCHKSDTRACLIASCSCRKPNPDPAIGDYAKKAEVFSQLVSVMEDELYPIYIRWGVTVIQGLKIDGVDATVDTLIEDGPEALIPELGAEIQRLIRLTPEESLGFKSPTTSGAPVDGQKNGTGSTDPSIAPLASESSPTETEFAAVLS